MLYKMFKREKNSGPCCCCHSHCHTSFEDVKAETVRVGDVLTPIDGSYMPGVLKDYLRIWKNGCVSEWKKVRIVAIRRDFIAIIPNDVADTDYYRKLPEPLRNSIQWIGDRDSTRTGSHGFWLPIESLTKTGECVSIKVNRQRCCC